MRASLRPFTQVIGRVVYTPRRMWSPKTHLRLSQRAETLPQSWSRCGTKRQHPISRLYSTKPSPEVTSQLGSPDAKLGLKDRLKKLFKEYGYLSVGVYLAFSALDFPFCFLAVRLAGPERIGQLEHRILSSLKGITEPVWQVIEPVVGPTFEAIGDTVSRIRKGASRTAGMDSSETSSVSHAASTSEAASIWTQLALAYGIHKTLLIFVRVPLTAMFTPRIARALRARGWKIGSQSS